jgi:hypothetical protein
LYEKYKPTREIVYAASGYVDDFYRWRTFGFKDTGGMNDQEAEYLDAIEVCKMAWDVANREAEEDARKRADAKAKKGKR